MELQLRMAGDSRVLMDHNMEIGVTSAQVNCTATTGQNDLYCLSTTGKHYIVYDRADMSVSGVVIGAYLKTRESKRWKS